MKKSKQFNQNDIAALTMMLSVKQSNDIIMDMFLPIVSAEFFRKNLVLAVIIFSLLVYIPICIIVCIVVSVTSITRLAKTAKSKFLA